MITVGLTEDMDLEQWHKVDVYQQSLAMVFNGLGQKVLPTAVADTIYNNTNEMNVSGLGTSGKGAVYAINAYGYKHTVITTREQLIAALQSGKPVFATVGMVFSLKVD